MANINIKKFVNSIQVLMSVFTDLKNGWPVMRRIIDINFNAERATGFL